MVALEPINHKLLVKTSLKTYCLTEYVNQIRVFHVLTYADTQSLSLHVPPLVNYPESLFSLPLPSALKVCAGGIIAEALQMHRCEC